MLIICLLCAGSILNILRILPDLILTLTRSCLYFTGKETELQKHLAAP